MPKKLSNSTEQEELEGRALGEEGDGVRIDNSSSLETWAREQGSNPEPGFLWAAGPVDRRTTHLRFSRIEPPLADTKNVDPCSKKSQTKEIIAPNEGLITAPNGDTDLETISIDSKSTPATNQEPTQERGMGPQPGPMTLTPEQDNQAAKLRFLTNERTPGPGAILPPLNPSTQLPQPCLPNALMDPPCFRTHSALDSQLASLEVIKHAAWKPPQSTFQGEIPLLSTNKWPRI
ncbi:hypothetical protein DSO57_1028845 [Entomophthora muscae]|uniref:Uncharacterized protein n=1 Tax=Entomophthora muscae TaxID=34485 RepID=A0ACC2SQQ7_9FUNG|nr:hypothetical protein DSO57_1028845 [Entomophthora muscae]